MAGWLVVLVVTNCLTVAALVTVRRRDRLPLEDHEDVFTAPRPPGVTNRSRRLITIEVLNPIELVSTRGRMAGLASSLAPGIARRMVYDRVLKTLRRELADKQVIADVRLHELRPLPTRTPTGETSLTDPDLLDEVLPVELDTLPDDQE